MSQDKRAPRYDTPFMDQRGILSREWYQYLTRGMFESTEQGITNAAVTSIAHGLGETPKWAELVLRCKTVQYDYAVNDEIACPLFRDGTDDLGAGLVRGAVNVTIVVAANGIEVPRRDAGNIGVFGVITNASWRLVARAGL